MSSRHPTAKKKSRENARLKLKQSVDEQQKTEKPETERKGV